MADMGTQRIQDVSQSLRLPVGCCNYRDLTGGGARCGCQRFWLRAIPTTSAIGAAGETYCFCGHHACFHHDKHYSPLQGDVVRTMGCGSSSEPFHGIEDGAGYEQHQHVLFDFPLASTKPPANYLPFVVEASAASRTEINTQSAFGNSDNMAHADRFDRRSLVANSFRPQASEPPARSEPVLALQDAHGQAADALCPSPIRDTSSTRSSDDIRKGTRPSESSVEMQNLLRSCAQRLDVLESLSFSYVSIDEIQDKFELLDARILELEDWKAEAKDTLSESQSVPSGSNALRAGLLDCEHRMTDLEERLNYMEMHFPSFANPWIVEVVFLPWGRSLGGMWRAAHEASTTTEGIRDLQRHRPLSESTSYTPGLDIADEPWWTAQTIESWTNECMEVLHARAPSTNGIVHQRLSSCGFIQKVAITSSGAREIWQAILEAFPSIRDLDVSSVQVPDASISAYKALRQPLIPLRKIRKSSELAFLASDELLTSATWDASFLNAGVLMRAKGGVKRLYITSPAAYLQSDSHGWTWDSLHRFAIAGKVQTAVSRESNGEQTCWAFTERLDGLREKSRSPFQHSDISHQTTKDPETSFAGMSLPRSPISRMEDKLTVEPQAGHHFSSIRPPCTPPTEKRSCMSLGDISMTPKRLCTLATQLSHEPQPGLAAQWSGDTQSPMDTAVEHKTPQSPHTDFRTNAGGDTPFAYPTPHSTNIATVYLAGADGGDTEPDSPGLGPESEKEWEGVQDDDNDTHDDDHNEINDLDENYDDTYRHMKYSATSSIAASLEEQIAHSEDEDGYLRGESEDED